MDTIADEKSIYEAHDKRVISEVGFGRGFFLKYVEIDTFSYSFDPSRTVLVHFSMVQISM